MPMALSPAENAAVAALDAVSAGRLADSLPDPVIAMDGAGFLLHANPAAQDAFGALRPGLSLPLRFRAPEMQALVEKVLSGNPYAGVVEYAERVPLEREFRVSAATLAPGLHLLFFRDPGEARRIDRMRADFVANASHELRTPLAAIAGFVETLRGPAREDAKARDRFLSIIQEQTSRMSRLIDDLLSLSHLESRPFLDLHQTIDLREVVTDVREALAPLAGENGVAIETEMAQGAFEVGGSRDELFQVLANLVENACKYGASGGRVRIALERGQAGEIELSVRDWGPGIPPEHLPRITERFYRADVAASRAKRGTGLGLSIVKHIASRHQARLRVESVLGEGSTFNLVFRGR